MRELKVVVWCDMCGRGTEATMTVSVGMDGAWREVDLCAKHTDEATAVMRPLMQAGRIPEEAPRPLSHRAAGKPVRQASTAMGESRIRNRALREWARGRGLADLQPGDYIPRALQAAYAAHLRERGGE